jgi:D-alanyl-D-alanine carboxypeptidase
MTSAARRSVASAGVFAVLVGLPACRAADNSDRPDPSTSVTAPSTRIHPTSTPTTHVLRFPAPTARTLPASTTRRLDRILRACVRLCHRGVTGLTASVITDQGHWEGSAGRSGVGERLTPDTSFAIGGITQTFTAAEVMHLASEGRVDLNARLSSYVDLPVRDNGARVRDALEMRSGIGDYRGEGNTAAKAIRDPDNEIGPAALLAQTPQHVDKAGALYEYSNTNYVLLGMLVENVTKMPFAQALREDLLAPAGLTRVAVQDAELPAPPLAHSPPGYGFPSGPYLPSRAWAGYEGASALAMTADANSVATWGYLLYGGRVLPTETLQAMLPDDDSTERGIGAEGMRAGNSSDVVYVGYEGGSFGYRSLVAVVRGQPVSIAVLLTTTEESSGNPHDVIDDLARVVLAAR